MSSWFSSLTENAAALVKNVPKIDTDMLQNLPKIDNEMIQKFSLMSPELTAERRKIDEEEQRKEAVRDKLSGLLPWETRDPERDILVEECKEAILKLSDSVETFTGPWTLPKLSVKLEEEAEEGDEGEQDVDNGGDIAVLDPSPETMEKLKKLEPLPVLLKEFDLDSHVGLIQRLLQEDPKLIKMQSKHSGGGQRENVFWRNYFFHCGYTRFEAGLSVDEIWSDQPPVFETIPEVVPTEELETPVEEKEVAISFENAAEDDKPVFGSDEQVVVPDAEPEETEETEVAESVEAATPARDTRTEIEVTEDDLDDVAEDYVLDELEAEIAKELEEIDADM